MGKMLNVTMLGGFSLNCGDKTIDEHSNRSKRVWTLIQYLVANRSHAISQNDLIEALWSEDEDIGDPANTLKTVVHRARTLLDTLDFMPGRDMIVYHAGAYSWNNSMDITVDAEEFDRMADAAVKEENESARAALLTRALSLFSGEFLPKNALESWVVPINTMYHGKYIELAHEAISMLSAEGRFDSVIALCHKAIVIDPYDEQLHLSLIQALVDTGAHQQAMQHYNYVTELFFKRFGVTPSHELTALYKEVVKTSKSTEMDLGVIRDGLNESERVTGAFYCEYEFFKDIYRLEARSAGRSGQIVHIGLITVLDSYGKKLTTQRRNTVMEKLQETIRESLRRCDIFTRYSVTQYLVMLPSASFENADIVMNRISRSFKRQYPKFDVILHFSVIPLEPVM